jgi:hypothetical protein
MFVSGSAFVRAVTVCFLALLATDATSASEVLQVRAGFSEVIRADSGADVIIVGNDEIANAILATEDTIVVTGRQPGATNLILLDEEGNEILSRVVRVVAVDRRPQFNVQLIAGRETQARVQYRCGPEPGCVPGAAVPELVIVANGAEEETPARTEEAEAVRAQDQPQ